MALIKWSEKYSVGNKQIDDQHKKWLEIYNTAHEKMVNPDGSRFRSIGIEALQAMKAYTEYHFSAEENFMAAIGFEELAYHRQLHENFVKKLKKMILEITDGAHILNSEIIKTIENWLVHHILNEDQKIKTIVESR